MMERDEELQEFFDLAEVGDEQERRAMIARLLRQKFGRVHEISVDLIDFSLKISRIADGLDEEETKSCQ